MHSAQCQRQVHSTTAAWQNIAQVFQSIRVKFLFIPLNTRSYGLGFDAEENSFRYFFIMDSGHLVIAEESNRFYI